MSPSPPSAPVPAYVPSSHAEDAAALLFRTLGHYRTAQAAMRTATRPRRLRRVPVNPAQEQAQATLVRMLSITEGFTGDTLLRHAEPLARASPHAVAFAVYDDAAIAAVRDWQAMRSAYRRWLEVKWQDSDYEPVHIGGSQERNCARPRDAHPAADPQGHLGTANQARCGQGHRRRRRLSGAP